MSAAAARPTLPLPTFDVAVCRDLAVLAPAFRAALARVLRRMEAQGHRPMVWETLRTDARQAFLYGFGRTWDDGRGVVTYSRDADETWHGYGLAADVICAVHRWNASTYFWRDLERAAEAEGLTCGRDWDQNDATKERFVDAPHLQWGQRPHVRRSPSPAAARLAAAGGHPAVWRAVGAAA